MNEWIRSKTHTSDGLWDPKYSSLPYHISKHRNENWYLKTWTELFTDRYIFKKKGLLLLSIHSVSFPTADLGQVFIFK